MRRICIAAILVGAVSGSALAQSLRLSYGPDGTSQAAWADQAYCPGPQYRPHGRADDRVATGVIARGAGPKLHRAGSCTGTSKPRLAGFFATIFARPNLLSHAFRPGQSSSYYGSPCYAPQSYAPQAY